MRTLKIYALYFPIEDGWWGGRVVGIPEIITQGRTLRECKKFVKDALRMHFEDEGAEPVQGQPVLETIRVQFP